MFCNVLYIVCNLHFPLNYILWTSLRVNTYGSTLCFFMRITNYLTNLVLMDILLFSIFTLKTVQLQKSSNILKVESLGQRNGHLVIWPNSLRIVCINFDFSQQWVPMPWSTLWNLKVKPICLNVSITITGTFSGIRVFSRRTWLKCISDQAKSFQNTH